MNQKMDGDTFKKESEKRVIVVDDKMKILKLKVKSGTMIYDGRILLVYEQCHEDVNGEGMKQKKMLKSTEAGIIRRVMVKEGDIVLPGSEIIELEKECNHPTVIKDLCAECGADLQKENVRESGQTSQACVSMVHMVPELKVNDELAQMLGKADMDRLLEHGKLVLLVDLDQTLIHTTNDNIPNNIKDVYHFQLYGPPSPWYHTRLRPGTHNFLRSVSEKYELHICTFGSRRYAHTIAHFLDPDGKYFSHRILSRDECFDSNSKTANLKALFPCGENMVCIIDDREDVWDYASNLIHVKPYHFFQHTGDIHAPPGLTKCENDTKDGFDFSQLENKSNSNANSIEENTYVDECITKNEISVLIDESKEVAESIEATGADNEKFDNGTEDEENKTVQSSDIDSSDSSIIISNNDESRVCDSNREENVSSTGDDNFLVRENSEIAKLVEPPVVSNPKEHVNEEKIYESMEIDTTSNSEITALNASDDNSPTENISKADIHGCRLESELGSDGFIVIEESDDYLLYLEEILKIIHIEFFKRYKQTGEIADLKSVIPETRATVLEGVSIVFSGIVPNRMKLENSPAYKIARSLGAKVTQNIESHTTHLVAWRSGTAKVHASSKRKNVKLVTPEWLWTCAERWEKVDERLFPLQNATLNIESRHPPAHCRSPDHPEPSLPYLYPSNKPTTTTTTTTTQSGSFLYTINPLMSLSSEDIECMEGEVNDMFNEDAEAEAETDQDMFNTINTIPDMPDEDGITLGIKRRLADDDSSSSSANSVIAENDGGRRFKKRKKMEQDRNTSEDPDACVPDIDENEDEDDDDDNMRSDTDDDNETIADKFRRGADLPNDLDIDYNSEEGTEEEHESDGEWNVMGAALEREFLDGGD